MSINFYTTQEEAYLIERIAQRAVEINPSFDKLSSCMDLSACHNSNPLRLQQLLHADESNFTHDVYGIYNCLNRTTGELENLFRPRYSI